MADSISWHGTKTALEAAENHGLVSEEVGGGSHRGTSCDPEMTSSVPLHVCGAPSRIADVAFLAAMQLLSSYIHLPALWFALYLHVPALHDWAGLRQIRGTSTAKKHTTGEVRPSVPDVPLKPSSLPVQHPT